MVYVFKKLNNMTGDVNPTQNSGEVLSSTSSGQTSQENPYQSTYRNPSKVYQANLNENMGGLETGLNKNLADTQAAMDKSTADYKTGLSDISNKYAYNGQSDLDKIGDESVFKRLSSLVSPTSAQTELKSQTSNTKNYTPDTQGVASASTTEGLSNLLRDQYNTSAGGSRLDAQLYRGSGQAGAALNKNLNQINQFNTAKDAQLAGETKALDDTTKQIGDRSTQLNKDAVANQEKYLTAAQQKAQQTQSDYDTRRNQEIQNLTNARNAIDFRSPLSDIVNQEMGNRSFFTDIGNMTQADALQYYGISPEQAQWQVERQGKDGRKVTNLLDIAPYLKNQIINSAANQYNLNGFDVNPYVESQSQFNQNMFVDPRYNQLSQLLGNNQIATETPIESDVSVNRAGYDSAIQNYLNQQQAAARSAVQALLSGGGGSGDVLNVLPNVRNTLANPIYGQVNNPLAIGGISGIARGIGGGLF